MTTRNFRVHNGISVGDIVISASANTITGGSTAAPNADGQFANKKYVDDSLAGLSQNSISQLNTNITITDTGTNGTIAMTCDGNSELTVTDAGVRVHGNLTVDGTQTESITVSIIDEISDNDFDAVADQTVSVAITDNDVPGFTIVELDGSTDVDESGTTDTFTCLLYTSPSPRD